jgi:hypothetical protein
MTYRSTLSQAFPYVVEADREVVNASVVVLMSPHEQTPDGSSFAVTVDAPPGRANLHLSDASLRLLQRAESFAYRAVFDGLSPTGR